MLSTKLIEYINSSLKYHTNLSDFTINVLKEVKKYLKKNKRDISFEEMRKVLSEIVLDCGNEVVGFEEHIVIHALLHEITFEESKKAYEQMKKH